MPRVSKWRVRPPPGRSVNVPLKLGRSTNKSTLNQIAGILRVDRKEIVEVLQTWTREQLREHLSQFAHAELRRPGSELRPSSSSRGCQLGGSVPTDLGPDPALTHLHVARFNRRVLA
jgi:hypothetical protein